MSEMTLSEMQAELAKLGNLARAISKANEIGQAAGAQLQLMSERQVALDQLQADIGTAQLQLADLRAQADQIGAANAQSQAAANAAVTQQIADATAQSQVIVADAKAQADAQKLAARNHQDNAAAAAAARDAAQAELDDITKKIADAKAQAKLLIGEVA